MLTELIQLSVVTLVQALDSTSASTSLSITLGKSLAVTEFFLQGIKKIQRKPNQKTECRAYSELYTKFIRQK